jgi:hypothetical protein
LDRVLRDHIFIRALPYLDDLIIFTKSPDFRDHLKDVEEIFKALIEAQLSLNAVKCTFFQKKLEYIGYTISQSGVEQNKQKMDAILDFPTPTKTKHLRPFIGMCNYHARAVPGYQEVVRPLNRLLNREENKIFMEP